MHRWAGGQGASGVQNFSGYYIQNQLYKIRVSNLLVGGGVIKVDLKGG